MTPRAYFGRHTHPRLRKTGIPESGASVSRSRIPPCWRGSSSRKARSSSSPTSPEIAPLLSELNQGRNLTLILDHHVAEASTDPRVLNLDPDLFGLKGDRDISGSTTCYLFARALDPANRDMAHIAAVGAVGDGFFVDGALVSENREVAAEAVRQGLLEIRKYELGEQYLLNGSEGQQTSSTSATILMSWGEWATTARTGYGDEGLP